MNISVRRAAKNYLNTVLDSCHVLLLERVDRFGEIFVKPILASGPLGLQIFYEYVFSCCTACSIICVKMLYSLVMYSLLMNICLGVYTARL